jgi:hypothetical protein
MRPAPKDIKLKYKNPIEVVDVWKVRPSNDRKGVVTCIPFELWHAKPLGEDGKPIYYEVNGIPYWIDRKDLPKTRVPSATKYTLEEAKALLGAEMPQVTGGDYVPPSPEAEYNALKEKGFKNLKGDERARYSELKAQCEK